LGGSPSFALGKVKAIGAIVRLSQLASTCLLACLPGIVDAQLPLAPVAKSGQTVTPVFEGWYRNPDGTFSISFGYYNRNADEVIEIPIGSDNFFAPGDSNRGQPTRFEARRHWAARREGSGNFGTNKLTWTLKVRGETFAIPASLHVDWEIDALAGEAGTGNTPPVLKLPGLPVPGLPVAGSPGSSGGPTAQGPGGAIAGPLTIAAGQPLTLSIWATDDGRGGGSVAGGRGNAQVALAWFKHQGPGMCFDPSKPLP
jgi:hypothetical protein